MNAKEVLGLIIAGWIWIAWLITSLGLLGEALKLTKKYGYLTTFLAWAFCQGVFTVVLFPFFYLGAKLAGVDL